MSYVKVEECPTPFVGLKWTEMYSYFGEVIAELGDSRFVIRDSVDKHDYIMTVEEFKKKFSYGYSVKGCWVRFDFEGGASA